MKIPIFIDTWMRGPEAPSKAQPAAAETATLGPLARLVPLLACLGIFSTSSRVFAQDGSPEAASSEASGEDSAPEEAVAPTEGFDEEDFAEEDFAEEDFAEESADAQVLEGMVMTGFRKSLGAALKRKQNTTAQVDAIVAEDMADFPDLNLAESLQRIPGVTIDRQNGEGRRITVRGLSGLYTRTRVNGMDARAGIGNNASRSFDFNLFASELFNSIVVHKTATAELGEGSLGAVVDLNTGGAFDYKEGFTVLAAANGVYNDLSDSTRPRLAGLLAYQDPGGFWGATASVAYSKVRNDSSAQETIRWQKSRFNSVLGNPCYLPNGDPTTDAGCAEVEDAFHARIPRYNYTTVSGERVGLTGGLELRPWQSTRIRLDGLLATYDFRTERNPLELLFRGNEDGMDVTGYTLEREPERFGRGNSTLTRLEIDNGLLRSEAQMNESSNRFEQVTLAIDHDFSDELYVNALAGISRSQNNQPLLTTMQYDNRAYDGYVYDYANDETPLLQYNGPDVTDPATFTLTELRDRVHETDNGFDALELHLHYDPLASLQLSGGVTYKVSTIRTYQAQRSGGICDLGLHDCSDGSEGPLGTPELSQTTEFVGDVGAGSGTRWARPNIPAWAETLGFYDVETTLDYDSTYAVNEKALGYYLQAGGELPVGSEDMRFLYNAGVRYVETRQESFGVLAGEDADGGDASAIRTITRPTYRDFLPSANAALWFSDQLVARLAGARVMSRPQLRDLSPSASVGSFNFEVDFRNPDLDPTRAWVGDLSLEWYFGDEGFLGAAGFAKSIDSFPLREGQIGTFASTGLPVSTISPTSPADPNTGALEGNCGNPQGCWEISRLVNGPGATILGFELGFQAPLTSLFGRLPAVVNGLGLVANYTYVQSEVDYTFQGETVAERLVGLSNQSYNATVYYEDDIFSARVSVAGRSNFLSNGPNRGGNLWEFQEPNTRIDFASSYNVSDNLELSLEALNLTNTPTSTRVDIDANRRSGLTKFGRNLIVGARFSY